MGKNSNYDNNNNRKGSGINDENLLAKREGGTPKGGDHDQQVHQGDNREQSQGGDEGIPIRPNNDRVSDTRTAERPERAIPHDVPSSSGDLKGPVTLKRNSPSFLQTANFLDDIRADFTEGSVTYIKAIDLRIAALDEEIRALRVEKERVKQLTESMVVFAANPDNKSAS